MKTIQSKHGPEVEVTHIILRTNDHLHVIEATAKVGSTVHQTMRHTIGAVDGPRVTLTTEQLQKIVDDFRQRVADEAAWKETVAKNLEGVK